MQTGYQLALGQSVKCVLPNRRRAAPLTPEVPPSGEAAVHVLKPRLRAPGPQRGGGALAHPAPRPGALSIPGLLWEWSTGGHQVAYRTIFPPRLGPVGGASSWEPPVEPPAYQTNSPGKQLLPVETTCQQRPGQTALATAGAAAAPPPPPPRGAALGRRRGRCISPSKTRREEMWPKFTFVDS
jgi:hypothetical protein